MRTGPPRKPRTDAEHRADGRPRRSPTTRWGGGHHAGGSRMMAPEFTFRGGTSRAWCGSSRPGRTDDGLRARVDHFSEALRTAVEEAAVDVAAERRECRTSCCRYPNKTRRRPTRARPGRRDARLGVCRRLADRRAPSPPSVFAGAYETPGSHWNRGGPIGHFEMELSPENASVVSSWRSASGMSRRCCVSPQR